MPTLIDRLFGRTPEKAIVTGSGGTGPGVVAYSTSVPLWNASKNPRKLMRQAQELYRTHDVIHQVEHRVSSTAAGVKWHLEDDQGEEIDAKHELRAFLDLMEYPQANIPIKIEKMSRRSLWQVAMRHGGLCGLAFWYLDQRDGLYGVPQSFLYINPARMWAVYDKAGNTIGWKLDADDDGQGGVPIELDEILKYTYDPPDLGAYPIGIVESAGRKAFLNRMTTDHEANTLASGGRLSGIFAPKETSNISVDDWAQFVRDWRNIAEDPNAAKRAQIAKQPIEHIRTSATPQELEIAEVWKLSREDIYAAWGLPQSQQGINQPSGLNSGETKGYDEAVLWQGPVHSRLEPFHEMVQGFLDDVKRKGGPAVELVLEEPEFDDETPLYDRAQKAVDQPLTDNDRRAILGLDPLPDYGPDGKPLGLAIYRPGTLTLVGQGPEPNGKFGNAPVEEEPEPPEVPELPELPEEMPAKASLSRKSVTVKWEPRIREAVAAYLSAQRATIAKRVRERGSHIAAKPSDTSVWWNGKRADEGLAAILVKLETDLAETVASGIKLPGKADTFAEKVADLVARTVGERITGINETTRDDVARIIAQGFDDGLSPAEVASLIEQSTAFDAARAELIARTETALAYNESALRSYEEFGVARVQAIDGDEDEECAARNGQVFSLEEAMGITDHPNGTLDWVPL